MIALNNSDKTRCATCESGIKTLDHEQIARLLVTLPEWIYVPDTHSIKIEYQTTDFITAVKLVQEIALVAEKIGHHPDIHLVNYKYLTFELTTHAAGGLTENDFILGARISHQVGQRATVVFLKRSKDPARN